MIQKNKQDMEGDNKYTIKAITQKKTRKLQGDKSVGIIHIGKGLMNAILVNHFSIVSNTKLSSFHNTKQFR